MTYYVPKNDFHEGDVADADKLMDELYSAAEATSRIDQNNIASSAINYSVAIPPNSIDTANRHRGPFAAYNESGLLYEGSGSLLLAASMTNLNWTEGPKKLSFTSNISAHYTFFLQATAGRASVANVPLNIDAGIMVNGSLAERTKATSSAERTAGTNYVPIFHTATVFLEPGDWVVSAAFRPMVLSGAMPDIYQIALGVVGFIR